MAKLPRRYDNLADFDFESLVAPQNVNQQLNQNNQPIQIAQNEQFPEEDPLALNQDVESLDNQSYAANSSYASKAKEAGERYLNQKKAERTTTADILKKAQDALLARSQEGWTSGDWFRLSAALGKPTRTGNFGETLGNAAEVMASVADRQTKSKQDYEALKLKYQLQNAAQPAEDTEQEFNVYTKLAGGRGQSMSRLRQMQEERDSLPKNDPARAELDAAIQLMTSEKKTRANSPSGQFVDLVNIANDPNQPKEVREAAAAKIRKDTYIPPEKAPKSAPPPVIDLTGAQNTGIRLGVPIMQDNPFANVDQKTQQQLVLQASKRAQAEIAKIEEEADKAQFSQQKMERFLKLNKENPTGAVTGKLPSFRAAAQEMDNITAELAPQKRIAGSGSVSDFDAKQLLKAVVNPSNSYEANKNIGAAWDAYAKTIKEKSNFMRNYFTANKTLDGANQQWMRYMTANPIFDPKAPGTFAPNKARKTYKDFFYPQQQKATGGRVGYAEGGAVDTAYADDYDPTLDVLASKYGAYTGGQVGLMDSPYGDVYHPEATDLSVLANKYAYGGSVKKNQYDEFGRRKFAKAGEVKAGYKLFDPNGTGFEAIFGLTPSRLNSLSAEDRDYVNQQHQEYLDNFYSKNGNSRLLQVFKPFIGDKFYWIKDPAYNANSGASGSDTSSSSTSGSGTSGTGTTDTSSSTVGRKFNPYTGDPYNYENMSQHDFYGNSNADELTGTNNQGKATSNQNADSSNRTTDNPAWFEYLQNLVDATPRKYTNQAPQLDKLLSQDYLLNLDDSLFAKGGAVKHPQYDAQGRQKLAWGGNVAFGKPWHVIDTSPTTTPTPTPTPTPPPTDSGVTTSLPLPVVIAATNLGRKYKAFTGDPYKYGYGNSHEFYSYGMAKGGSVKHPQYDAQGRQKLGWGGLTGTVTAYAKADPNWKYDPNASTTVAGPFGGLIQILKPAAEELAAKKTSDTGTGLPLPLVVAATNLGRKYKAFTGNPYEYGYGGSHEFYVDDSSANFDTSSSDTTSSKATSTDSTVEAPSNTATLGSWKPTPSLVSAIKNGWNFGKYASGGLARKYKAFTGNPYNYGYSGEYEFYSDEPSANSDTSSSNTTSSEKTSTDSSSTPTPTAEPTLYRVGWNKWSTTPPPPPRGWNWSGKAMGGAVRMQEGGTPPESVVRLKPIRSDDSTNRARAFFGQGMGMSIGDEAEALYRRYLTDEGNNKSYGQLVDEVRNDYRRWSEENPEQQMTFELSGGIAPTVGAMMMPGGQGAAGANTARMANMFTKTPLRRAVTGAGASGAVSGFNAGEDTLSNRLGSAAESGATSAVLGPVIGKAGQLALRGGKGAVNLAKRPFQIGDSYYENQAMDKVLAKMRQDGVTPRQALGRVADERGLNPTTRPVGTRPDTRLMDTSQGLTDLAETVTQRPGGGRTAMVEDMKSRVRGTKGKVTQMTNEALAGNKAYFKEVTDLTKDLRSKADTAYQAAYAHGDVSDPRIMGILDTPEFKRAYQEVMKTNQIKKANAIARGEDPSQFDMKQIYRVKPGQNPDNPILDLELTDVPDVKTLDNIKQGIDTVIAKGFQSDDKISRDAANALKQLKNTYVGIIDDAVPAYKVARNQYKGDIEIIDALEAGRNQYSKMLPDEAKQYVSTLSDAEKQALRVGYAQNFATKIGEAKNSINAAEQIIGAENERLRLRALFNSDAEYKVFENALMAESRNFKNAGQIVANSATERRAMGRKEFESKDSAVGEILDATRGGVTSTVLSILRKAPSLFQNEKIAEKVSHILSTGTPQEINGILKQLDKRAAGFARAARKDERVGYAGAKGTGRAAGQTPIAASYEEPAPEQLPSAIDPSSEGALDPSESVVFDSPDLEMQDESVETEQPEMVMPEQRYRGGSVRHFDSGGYADLTDKEIVDHAKMVEYQKIRRKQADDYLKQVYDKRAKMQSRSPVGGVGGGAAIGHMSDPSSVKSLIPNFASGGYAREADYVSDILDRVDVNAYADQMQQGKNRSKFMTGRLGYRQPIGDNSQISGGLSGRAVEWEGEDDRGNKYQGGKSGVSGADLAYEDDKQRLAVKYALPQRENNLAFQGLEYARKLANNRGNVGGRYSRISPEGIRREPQAEIFYNRQFKTGGSVKTKAVKNVMRKMAK